MSSLLKTAALSMVACAALAAPALAADPRLPPPYAPPAPPAVAGYIEGYAAWSDTDASGWDGYHWLGGGGAARLNWMLAPGWSLQTDISAENMQDNVYSGYYNETNAVGAVHLSMRDQTYLLGAFGGIAAINDEGGDGIDTAAFIGAEGQLYLGGLTLYAQAGYIAQTSGYYGFYYPDYKYDFGFAQLTGRFFLTPDTKLEASVGLIGGGDIWGYYGRTTVVTWGVEVEQKLNTSPFSVFARAGGFHANDYYDVSEWHAQAGIKASFGGGSLLGQDRGGATLKVMDFSPIGWLRAYD